MTNLNCKPGQNAIVVGKSLNLGKIGKVLHRLEIGVVLTSACGKYMAYLRQTNGKFEWVVNGLDGFVCKTIERYNDFWVMDNFYRWVLEDPDGGGRFEMSFPVFDDDRLKPLLDIEGEDEMIVVAGKPEEIVHA